MTTPNPAEQPPPAEQAFPAAQQQTPPPTAAPFDVKNLATEIARAVREAPINVNIPAPQSPNVSSEPWDDPKYWLVSDQNPEVQGKETREKMEKYVQARISKATKPLEEKLSRIEAGVHYLDMAKTSDKDFVTNQNKIAEIAQQENISFKAAKRIFDAELAAAKAAEKPAEKPVAPAKPPVPKTAHAPAQTSESVNRAPKQKQRVRDIIADGIAKGELKWS